MHTARGGSRQYGSWTVGCRRGVVMAGGATREGGAGPGFGERVSCNIIGSGLLCALAGSGGEPHPLSRRMLLLL